MKLIFLLLLILICLPPSTIISPMQSHTPLLCFQLLALPNKIQWNTSQHLSSILLPHLAPWPNYWCSTDHDDSTSHNPSLHETKAPTLSLFFYVCLSIFNVRLAYDNIYLLSSVLSYDQLSPSYKKFVAAISTTSKPKTFSTADKDKNWHDALAIESSVLEENNTWTLTPLPVGKQPIGCKWVCKIKYKSDGSIERYKVCLVAKGFTQQEGINYHETFAPVAKLVTIQCLLEITSFRIGPYINLMFKMHFCMVTSVKRYTCAFLLAFLVRGRIVYANLINLFMDWSKPLEIGLPSFLMLLKMLGIGNQRQNTLYLLVFKPI